MTEPHERAKASLIELENVSCGYRKKTILQGIDFSVSPGERVAIIGDNGEGKSTLLNTLMGIHPPMEGKRTQNVPGSKVAFVAQRSTKEFMLPLRVEEFIQLGVIGLPKTQRRSQISEVLEQVHLSHRIKDDVSTLSGGQFQRLVLARAMVRQPKLMFLDEPTTGLDRKSSREFMNELERLCKTNEMATVMVLHHFRHLERDFNRLAWIHDGKVEMDTIENWLKHPPFLEFTGLGVMS